MIGLHFEDFFCQHQIVLCPLRRNIIQADRDAETRGLTQADISRDNGAKHLRIKVSPHILGDIMTEPGAGVEHGEKEAFDTQTRIEPFFYEPEGVHETLQTLQGIIFTLNRNQERVSSSEGVEGEEPE